MIHSHTDGAAQGISYQGHSWAEGGSGGATVRSGIIGSAITSGNTSMGPDMWVGYSTASIASNGALPTSVAASELDKRGTAGIYVPNVVLNNVSSLF